MSDLEFLFGNPTLALDQTSLIKIGVSHQLAGILRDLNLRVRVAGSAQVVGNGRVNLVEVPPGQLTWFEILLLAHAPGTIQVTLAQINARLFGRSLDFPDVALLLPVSTAITYPETGLDLISEPQTLRQNEPTSLPLRLVNNSSINLESVQLSCIGEPGRFTLQDTAIQIHPLPAYESVPVDLRITPQSAGEIRLAIELRAQFSGQPIVRSYRLAYVVEPDPRPQTTQFFTGGGDVVTGGTMNKPGGDLYMGPVNKAEGDQVVIDRSNSSRQFLTQPSDSERVLREGVGRVQQTGQTIPPADGPAPSSASQAPDPVGSTVKCPYCQEVVPQSAYCIHCGHSLHQPHPPRQT